MQHKRLKTRLRRAMVEALCLASDAETFNRRLTSWAETDAGLKSALSDDEMVDELAKGMIGMLESIRAQAPAQTSATVKAITEAKRVRQEPRAERLDRGNRS